MAIKKSELYSSLWKSCDELRGGMDASQYKDYVLVLLFVKYVSDKAASQKNYLLDVPIGGRFADMVDLKGDKEIGDKMNKIISKLAEANDLKGVIDVADVSEDLLDTFQKEKLLDPYDVYQHLMDYWAETMQDDVYLLVQEGWKAVLDGKPNTDLIPRPLIVARYFAKDQMAIEKLEADREAITRQMEEMDEEHGGEDGLLAEAKTDKGKLTKVSVRARLTEIKGDKEAADERKLLEGYEALIEKEPAADKQVKDAQKALDAQVAAKYSKLTADEIKTLVVDDKWLARLAADVQSELDRVSQALTGRIRQLAERYATPLPQLTDELATLGARVDEHLKKMGAVWK
jgi:type I restriction enzyme M protein